MNASPIGYSSARALLLRTFLTLAIVLGAGTANAGMEVQSVKDGEVVDLDNMIGQGKWTLVMLWATNCHICHEQKPKISAFHNEHKDSDAHVVGIALDGIERVDAVNAYLDKNKPSFPNYVGNIAIIASHYMALTEESLRGTPTYLLFNPEGELLGNNPGPLSVEAIEKFMARNDAEKATG